MNFLWYVLFILKLIAYILKNVWICNSLTDYNYNLYIEGYPLETKNRRTAKYIYNSKPAFINDEILEKLIRISV